MKDKDDWITQWIKIPCTHKRRLYDCTKILKQKRSILNIVISYGKLEKKQRSNTTLEL